MGPFHFPSFLPSIMHRVVRAVAPIAFVLVSHALQAQSYSRLLPIAY
jgi:hypothetical protein